MVPPIEQRDINKEACDTEACDTEACDTEACDTAPQASHKPRTSGQLTCYEYQHFSI